MDRFDAMQAFARVVEAGSFEKAAETHRIGASLNASTKDGARAVP